MLISMVLTAQIHVFAMLRVVAFGADLFDCWLHPASTWDYVKQFGTWGHNGRLLRGLFSSCFVRWKHEDTKGPQLRTVVTDRGQKNNQRQRNIKGK